MLEDQTHMNQLHQWSSQSSKQQFNTSVRMIKHNITVYRIFSYNMVAYIMLFPKAVSHFFQLLAHTFPEKLPGDRNVSQYSTTEIMLISSHLYIHTWYLHLCLAGIPLSNTHPLCDYKWTESWHIAFTW